MVKFSICKNNKHIYVHSEQIRKRNFRCTKCNARRKTPREMRYHFREKHVSNDGVALKEEEVKNKDGKLDYPELRPMMIERIVYEKLDNGKKD